MILSFSDETVQGTLEMGRNRMGLRNENCYHEKEKKKKKKAGQQEAVSSEQVQSQLCHSASSWPWNNLTESKDPHSEFIAVPEKSFAPS